MSYREGEGTAGGAARVREGSREAYRRNKAWGRHHHRQARGYYIRGPGEAHYRAGIEHIVELRRGCHQY